MPLFQLTTLCSTLGTSASKSISMRFWDKNYSVFKKVLPAPSWLPSLLNSSQLNGVGRKFVPCSRLCLAWNLDLGGSKRLLQSAQPSLQVVKGRFVGVAWQGLPVGRWKLFISLEGGGKTKMEEEEQNQEREWGRKKHCCSSHRRSLAALESSCGSGLKRGKLRCRQVLIRIAAALLSVQEKQR